MTTQSRRPALPATCFRRPYLRRVTQLRSVKPPRRARYLNSQRTRSSTPDAGLQGHGRAAIIGDSRTAGVRGTRRVIGAVVSPLMQPIIGLAAAVVGLNARRQLVSTGLIVLTAAESIGLAALVAWIVPVFQAVTITPEILLRTAPGILDLACAAGAAGAYVTARNRRRRSLHRARQPTPPKSQPDPPLDEAHRDNRGRERERRLKGTRRKASCAAAASRATTKPAELGRRCPGFATHRPSVLIPERLRPSWQHRARSVCGLSGLLQLVGRAVLGALDAAAGAISSERSVPVGERTTTTGQVAWWTHCWPTEPRRRSAKPPGPRDPTTRRSPGRAASVKTSAGRHWIIWGSISISALSAPASVSACASSSSAACWRPSRSKRGVA